MRDVSKMKVGINTRYVMAIYGSQTYVDDVLDGELPAFGNPYPLPSNGKINLPIHVPKASGSSHVNIDVFDSTGKIVSNVINDYIPAGRHTIEWESKQSGLFLIQMQMNGKIVTKKVIIH
jgi:hypothetical protein